MKVSLPFILLISQEPLDDESKIISRKISNAVDKINPI
jgi:hypothetical protein